MSSQNQKKGSSESSTSDENTQEVNLIEKIIVGLSASFLGLLILEVMVILGATFYRINVGLFERSPDLYVRALSSFGSTFLQGAMLGTGGIVAALQVVPKLISWARNNGYSLGKSGGSKQGGGF